MNLPLGYAYAAAYAGIRAAEKPDLALIVSGLPANAAAVFTQNRVQAAPVKLSRRHLKLSRGLAGAIVVNAGNANCATRTGAAVALATAKAAAKLLRLPVPQVLVASTGVIGVELDGAKITRALPGLVATLDSDRFDEAAHAILTTDLVPKTAFAEVKLRRGTIRIAGMTKGSGMIQPLMATTLGFVLTDANIPVGPAARHAEARRRIAATIAFRWMATPPPTTRLLLLANGASGVRPDPKEMPESGRGDRERDGIARASHRPRWRRRAQIRHHRGPGAPTDDAATRLARSIANSPLVKTAIAGSDPNWGRILSAAGNAGVAFDPAKTDVYLQGVAVCKGGLAAQYDEPELKKKLDAAECEIRLAIRGKGKGQSRFWTCDLTEGYIRINGSYRT